MWNVLLCMIGFTSVITLFVSWLQEQRRKAMAGEIHRNDSNSRQSRRYQESTLFEIVMNNLIAKESEVTETFQTFLDRFSSFTDVADAMTKAGMDRCHFIVAIDFTASNEWQGRRTFHKQCLHTILLKGNLNPYQQVISTLGSTLHHFNEAGTVHAFGFGDDKTRARSVFPFKLGGDPCTGFQEVLMRYTEISRKIALAGPTSFAPILKKSIKLVKRSGFRYHLLVIISDGQMGDDLETVKALVDASNYPLSVVMVGVGDGPWDTMEEYDDQLPKRKFDNFQFVDYQKATAGRRKNAQTAFALHALMEIPDQYKAIRQLGYL